MNYEKCLAACISILKAEDRDLAKGEIVHYFSYPLPSSADWAHVEKVMAEYEDDDNPFDWMGQNEIILSDRGIATVFGEMVGTLKVIAERVGLPQEYLPSCIELMDLMRPANG